MLEGCRESARVRSRNRMLTCVSASGRLLGRSFGDAGRHYHAMVSFSLPVVRDCLLTYKGYIFIRGAADILVSQLFALVRSSHLPTTIRTSSLSLLATCADTADLALLPYAHDLTNAMLDLLQVEGNASARAADADPPPTEAETAASMDSEPTAADARFPPFRRASLHFLGVLVRAYTQRASPSSSSGNIPLNDDDFPVRRATATLGYVAATDADAVVRVMAREVGEAVRALERARVGIGIGI
jgi:hypothetical protein